MPVKATSRQEKIYLELKNEILMDTYQPGDYLPTVRELAKRFQTSITPVYLALNRIAKEGHVSMVQGSGIQMVTRNVDEAATQAKPMIEFLGSTPNYLMRQAPRRSHIIIASSDWLLWGLSHSKRVRVSVSHYEYHNEEDFYETLSECQFTESAVVVFSDQENINTKTLRLLNQLQKEGKRVAHLGNREDFPHFDRVRSDFKSGSYALTRHLLEKGHTCLLRLHTTFNNWYEMKKQEGFQSALEAWRLETGEVPMGLVRSIDAITPSERGREDEFDEQLLREVLEFHPVTAILGPSDASVLYLRAAAAKIGRKDLEIVGYDNTWSELRDLQPHRSFIEAHPEVVRYHIPPVSVEVDAALLGTELAELAIKRALGELPEEAQTVMCPQSLFVPVDSHPAE